jgi:inner membrane protein
VFWDRASVNVGLSDPRGVVRISELLSGETRTKFAPGIAQMPGYALGFPTGMHAPAGVARPGPDGTYAVSFDFDLNGTRQIEFAMLGDEATVRLSSSWPHPSFIGGALPTTRTSTTEGFTAEWRTGAFWRAATAAGTGAAGVGNTFGVSLITPVDIYRQTDRAVKYAVLFIGATFLVAFLWEVTRGVLVHPVQYAFVGFSICVFYMLLLSGSEHAGFDPAYVVASAATVLLLSWYWRWVAGNRAQGGMMAVILSGMYGYLYLLLRLEDYALLAGSVGLFIALMLVMYLTRRVNWYRLGTTRQ